MLEKTHKVFEIFFYSSVSVPYITLATSVLTISVSKPVGICALQLTFCSTFFAPEAHLFHFDVWYSQKCHQQEGHFLCIPPMIHCARCLSLNMQSMKSYCSLRFAQRRELIMYLYGQILPGSLRISKKYTQTCIIFKFYNIPCS